MEKINKKILLAEDDSAIGPMYETKLVQDGFSVVLVTDGAAVLESLKEEEFDLILLDVIMPQLDGFSVLEELKNNLKTKDMPVIMLTNLGTDEDIEKGKSFGVVDYLVKSTLTPTEVSLRIKKFFNI